MQLVILRTIKRGPSCYMIIMNFDNFAKFRWQNFDGIPCDHILLKNSLVSFGETNASSRLNRLTPHSIKAKDYQMIS